MTKNRQQTEERAESPFTSRVPSWTLAPTVNGTSRPLSTTTRTEHGGELGGGTTEAKVKSKVKSESAREMNE